MGNSLVPPNANIAQHFGNAASLQAATVDAAAALTATLTGVDTGTDMTAAQAATIVADFLEIHTQLNALIAALKTAGIVASS